MNKRTQYLQKSVTKSISDADLEKLGFAEVQAVERVPTGQYFLQTLPALSIMYKE
jgi:hypothetical protein